MVNIQGNERSHSKHIDDEKQNEQKSLKKVKETSMIFDDDKQGGDDTAGNFGDDISDTELKARSPKRK